MMNDPFSHEPPKPFHSSVYTRVSRGNTIGSSSVQTFGERAHIERNRTAVPRYGNSKIGLGYIHRNNTSEAPGHLRRGNTDPAAPLPRPTGGIAPRPTTSQPARQSFNEPPTRRNPFA